MAGYSPTEKEIIFILSAVKPYSKEQVFILNHVFNVVY